MKAIEQYFPLVLFIVLKGGPNISVWMNSYSVALKMKPFHQYKPFKASTTRVSWKLRFLHTLTHAELASNSKYNTCLLYI